MFLDLSSQKNVPSEDSPYHWKRVFLEYFAGTPDAERLIASHNRCPHTSINWSAQIFPVGFEDVETAVQPGLCTNCEARFYRFLKAQPKLHHGEFHWPQS